MKRLTGLPTDHAVTAADQLQRSFPRVGIQPLPDGVPVGGRVVPKDIGVPAYKDPVFVIRGDMGGVKDPSPQNAVNSAINELLRADRVIGEVQAFVDDLGDEVYFNGDASEYAPQFYEPNAKVQSPVIAIPGNHDGDTTDDPSRGPLDTFLANFCTAKPEIPPADPQLEYGRHTMTLPSYQWTFLHPSVTIIGLYSNVPSGGHFEQSQLDWLTQELKDAPSGVPLIVQLHHPPYSVDAHHGGSVHMGDALDGCFEAAKRCADCVLSGHVHDYQRFTRTYWKREIPYVVLGNSGYHNLHKLAPDASPGSSPAADVKFEYGDDSEYGFVVAAVSGQKIDFEYVGVTPGAAANLPPSVTRGKDKFSLVAGA